MKKQRPASRHRRKARNTSLLLRSAVGFALLSAAACGTEAAPVGPALRDSAGIRIVEHPAGLELATWTLAAQPEATIGGRADEDVAHQFTQIRGAVRLSDGRLIVGDWGSREARYFDAAGNHLRTVGGQGTGPGELRNLYNVDRVRGDTLVIGGWPIGSRYWFDENGDFVRNQALGPWFPGLLGRTLVDGGLVLDTYEFGSYGNTLENWAANGTEEEIRPTGIVEIVSADGQRSDTIGTIRGETWHKTGELRQDFAMHALPLTPRGFVAWSQDHVFIGHTETPEVNAFDMQGSLSLIIRWVPDEVGLSRADRMTFEQELIDGIRPDREPTFRRWLSEITYPATKPSFSAMISDEEGNLWVRDSAPSDAETARWTVYGGDGQAVATITTPSDLEVLDVDATHLLAKRTDDLDVETILSFRVMR